MNTVAKKISGVKTGAAKARAVAKAEAKPKGGKPGSAMGNQSAQYAEGELTKAPAKVSADKITTVVGTRSGPDGVVIAAGKENIVVPTSKFVGELKKLAIVGGSLRAVRDYIATHKPEAKLADGVTARVAPNSAYAAAKSKARVHLDTKAAPVPATKAVTTVVKVAKTKATQKLAPKGQSRDYKPGKAFDRKAGTWTHYMVELAQRHTNTADATAAHNKSGQYDGKTMDYSWMAKEGFIKF